MSHLREEELQELYAWIDEIPLTRQKKNITRDFSDGVLAAEVVSHFFPKYVELHNYTPANATHQKVENWRTLNRKVFSQMNYAVPEDLLQGAATGRQGVIEFILTTLRSKIELHLQMRAAKNSSADGLYISPLLEGYQLDQMVTAYQPSQGLAWDGGRHAGEASGPEQTPNPPHLERTYPTESNTAGKNQFMQSRIPVPSRRKESSQHEFSGGNLPPLVSERQSLPKRKPSNRYAYNIKTAPLPEAIKGRDNSAKYKLLLAEKDQKLLETREYIQFLQMKLTRYEHLVHVKDMKIAELKRSLDSATGHHSVRHHPHYQHPIHHRR